MTHRTRIKICGIRRPQDALTAARAGADAVGLVFHLAAPRNISLDEARAILASLPAFVTPVALFVDAGVESVERVTRELHLRHVQLHGNETPEEVARLSHLAVIKAVRVDPRHFGDTLGRWRDAVGAGGLSHLKGLVLETAATAEPGGSGVPNDWQTVREHQARGAFDGLPPIIAAGGLAVDTVERVVRDVQPWAVDVSSGVELTRGIKSAEKIAAFVQAVRNADASLASVHR